MTGRKGNFHTFHLLESEGSTPLISTKLWKKFRSFFVYGKF